MRPFPRDGAWAVDEDGRVGVCFQASAIRPMTGAMEYWEEFHIVDSAGITTLTIRRDWDSLRQATLAEIPEGRRPSVQVGASLGYV